MTYRRLRTIPSWTLCGALVCAASIAHAQVPQAEQFQGKYTFVEAKEVKKVEWKASASAGFTLASGNSNILTISGGANASRNDGKNLLTLDLNGVYGLTTLPKLYDRTLTGGPCPTMMAPAECNGQVDNSNEVGSETKTTAGFLLFKGRYDRFFTTNNAGFLSGYVGTDFTASKKVNTGAQLGYSRQLFKTKLHELKAELGMDYNYINYILPEGTVDSNNVHLASARLFVQYGLTLGENTQFGAKAESLINLNPATIVERRAQAADATRVNAGMFLSTKIWGRLSFRIAFNLRYDNCPAPNANFKFAAYSKPLPTDVSCGSLEKLLEDPSNGYTPQDLSIYRVKYNQKLDTLTEANLVFSFL